MLRRIQITAPPEQVDELLVQFRGREGVTGIQLERGISEHPPGDLLTIEAFTSTYLQIMDGLAERGIGQSSSSSISVSQTGVVVSPRVASSLGEQASKSSWEEIQAVIAKTSNNTALVLVIMFFSGVITAVGIITGALHIVVGGLLIAPAFEPIIRVTLGWTIRSRSWVRGLVDTLQGYAALMLGATAAALLMRTTASPLLSESSGYMSVGPLVSYWTNVTLSSVLLPVVGGFVGALLVATNRSVLTSGVTITLALVPAATIVGIALGAGDLGLAVRALGRWALEVGVVLVSSGAFWLWYRARVQKRPSML